ncbi:MULTISPECIES: NUDIX hydrolase [unclassified Paenibacillus]|uniref:NUDIX domain-containing protein n=1 Tax=unclassified Paenibacillus TaxID=185978 RepID=UPI000955DEA3|nr:MULTISPECIES: NUDIX hydrolase [unclassified Paenibacillus]ASS65060.1 NUDIX hydrolase [Paenibacillus sp. RUD330]SIQ50034.1 ADP-ribose pyrophosphatase [Paenibacillus sp. RU4X]SIQ71943.1 ADP-ribose pyrophosphatase [Paenibacillus sp. RU4T]
MNQPDGPEKLPGAETTVSSETIFEGRIITLQVDQVQLPGGKLASREIVRHPGAAAVIALLDGKLLTVGQYRKPMDKYQVEIPAGKLDPGEDPAACAARELREETGVSASEMKLVDAFYTSPGFADEKVYLYAAEGLSQGESQPDDDEELHVEALTMEQAEAYIREGVIGDAKTLMAVYLWKLYLHTGVMGFRSEK